MDEQFLQELRKLIKKHYPDYMWSEIKVMAKNFSFEAKEKYTDPDQRKD